MQAESMDRESITRYITETFEGVDVVVVAGDTFFFHDRLDPSRRVPFATIVTRDQEHDRASNLDRPSVFRLNIGISKQTFRSFFGAESSSADGGGGAGGRYDFAALDRLLPHPVFGGMNWVCVLNPSASTFQSLRPLLAEAYGLSVRRYNSGQPEEEA
jgi:Family of unknown function (DUF6194)